MPKHTMLKTALWLTLAFVPGSLVQAAPPSHKSAHAPVRTVRVEPESGAHHAGRKVNETAKKVGNGVVDGSKVVGENVVHGSKVVGDNVVGGSKMVGHTIRDFFVGVGGGK